MSKNLTLEALLRDKETYEFLKSRYPNLVFPPPVTEVSVEDPTFEIIASTSSRVLDNDNNIEEPISIQQTTGHSSPTNSDIIVTVKAEPSFIQESICRSTTRTCPSPTYSYPSSSDDEAVTVSPERIITRPSPVPNKDTIVMISELLKNAEANSHHKRITDFITPPALFLLVKYKKWGKIACWCFDKEIKYKYVRRTAQGIKVIASTFGDYEELINLLLEKDISFCLASGRKLRTVINKVPSHITCDAISQALIEKKVPVQEVYRLGRGSDGISEVYDIVIAAVDWSAEGKAIYKMKSLCNVDVEVEKFGRTWTTKCPRCHLYGHFERPCTLPLKCKRCSGNHVTTDCPVLVLGNFVGLMRRPTPSAQQSQKNKELPPQSWRENMRNKASQTCQPHKDVTSVAVQVPSLEPSAAGRDDDYKADLDLVMRYINIFGGIEDYHNFLKLVEENEGNPLALVAIGMQRADIFKKLSEFRVNP